MKTVTEGKEVKFFMQFTLLRRLEPLYANKIIVEANHFVLETLENFLSWVNRGLMEERLVKRILGYKLHTGDINDLEVEDMDVRKDRVAVWLEWKSLKAKT